MDREKEKAQIDILYHEVLAYRSSDAFRKMMDSVRKLPQLSPYNAMMVALQKPGSVFVATPSVWRERYHRYPKPEARPLVILRPFGPICFVYEYNDTEGKAISDEDLQQILHPFKTNRVITEDGYRRFTRRLIFEGIRYREEELGTLMAASIRREREQQVLIKETQQSLHYIKLTASAVVNQNLECTEKFASLAHELGHYFCGHLGAFASGFIKDRWYLSQNQREFEAETAAWLCCERLGIQNPSADYLSGYLDHNAEIPEVSLDAILRAAGAIEALIKGTCRPRRSLEVIRKKA